MLSVPAVNQKINLGAMVHIQEVNLLQMSLKQTIQKLLQCVCVNKLRTLLTVMAHI